MLAGLARGPLLVNNPMALRDCNEKLFALQFPELIPPTLVASDPAALHRSPATPAPRVQLDPEDSLQRLSAEGILRRPSAAERAHRHQLLQGHAAQREE